MNRRTFLKISSLAVAAGCTSQPEKTLFSPVHAPDDLNAGNATWFASTCRECPAGCGVLAKNREGRVIKLEGNPGHPINRGALCIRGQASLQGIYHPDRLKTPMVRGNGGWKPVSYPEAENIIARKAREESRKGVDRVRIFSGLVGESLESLFQEALTRWNSDPTPLLFEPFSGNAIQAANRSVLGIAGLPAYHMENADLILAFGADFLETWLSPVEYAQKFKTMHAFDKGRKGRFIQISPLQTLTGANADRWIPCPPTREAFILFGLAHEMLRRETGRALSSPLREELQRICAPFPLAPVSRQAGIDPLDLEWVADCLMQAKRPLVLGTGAGMDSDAARQTEIGVLLLNLILNPELPCHDFACRHSLERSASHADLHSFLERMEQEPAGLLLLHQSNPVYTLPPSTGVEKILSGKQGYVVCFTNFMNETAIRSDLLFPTSMPLETWDAYEGKTGDISLLQPVMSPMNQEPGIGDVLLRCAFDATAPSADYRSYLIDRISGIHPGFDRQDWIEALGRGGIFREPESSPPRSHPVLNLSSLKPGKEIPGQMETDPNPAPIFLAFPALRHYDGRSSHLPWLLEIPDPVTLVSWQTVTLIHPDTMAANRIQQGERIVLTSEYGTLQATAFAYPGIAKQTIAMPTGQGHGAGGRYAENIGQNPLHLFPPLSAAGNQRHSYAVRLSSLAGTGNQDRVAHLDGSRFQHGRKIAVSVSQNELENPPDAGISGLGMWEFPLTLPLPEGYDPNRDMYAAHPHTNYRWGMVVDLDRCTGCGACVAACYAENNIGVVGEEQILAGREMAWLRIERYYDPADARQMIFFPMMCQHCDNAPCEAVCPVYAPHHGTEGLNNQIYNRCIGTRFCAQNCPYKVRRFNWLEWERPDPLPLQLNPDVTVRAKGVMEKCSFCIQRIKDAHDAAKNENRAIQDGDILPACVQTCPTRALVFGNLMDPNSAVRRLTQDRRAYQALGYLNTKPAVIYLKKVLHNHRA